MVIVPGVVLMRIVFGVWMRSEARGSVHNANLKLNIRAKFSREKRLFNQNEHLFDRIAAPAPLACGLFYGGMTPLRGTILAKFYSRLLRFL